MPPALYQPVKLKPARTGSGCTTGVPALNAISKVDVLDGPTVPLFALYVTIGAAGATPVAVVVAVEL